MIDNSVLIWKSAWLNPKIRKLVESSEIINHIANNANFQVETIFTDENNWFSVALLKKH